MTASTATGSLTASSEIRVRTKEAAVLSVAHARLPQQSALVTVAVGGEAGCLLPGCDCAGRGLADCWFVVDGDLVVRGVYGSRSDALEALPHLEAEPDSGDGPSCPRHAFAVCEHDDVIAS